MPPFEALKFDPVLTFPDSPPDELPVPEQSSATMNFDLPSAPSFEAPSEPVEQEATDPAVYMDLKPLESVVSEDNAAVPLTYAGDSELDAQGATESELPLNTSEQLEPIEADLAAPPNHDAMITAATEAARLALSQLNASPDSGASAESAKFPRSTSGNPGQATANAPFAEGEQHSAVQAPPDGAPSPASPEMIEALVNRLLERMQPQIMDVVNREVLRPAIEAMVRQEMKKN
jgi:hypothetical protein